MDALPLDHMNRTITIPASMIREGSSSELSCCPAGSFGDASQRYLRRQKPRLTSASYVRVERIITSRLTRFFGEQTKLASIRQSDVEKYIVHRKKNVSPASVQKELSTLKHLLSLAVEWGMINQNPAESVKSPKVSSIKTRVLTSTEVRLIVMFCPDWLQPIVNLAAYTGMTRREILDLRWQDIDLDRGQITVRSTRRDQERVLPIAEPAREALSTLLHHVKRRQNDLVFNDEHMTPGNLSQAFLRACHRAEISGVSFNSLRYSFASWLLEGGADLVTVSQLLGYRDLRMASKFMAATSVSIDNSFNFLNGTFAQSSPRKART